MIMQNKDTDSVSIQKTGEVVLKQPPRH